MGDRVTLIDGTCRECKQVLERVDVSDLSPNAALAEKQRIKDAGMVAFHYTADPAALKTPLLAHKANCKTLQPPAIENKATEAMAAALGVKSKAAKKKAAKRKLGRAKK